MMMTKSEREMMKMNMKKNSEKNISFRGKFPLWRQQQREASTTTRHLMSNEWRRHTIETLVTASVLYLIQKNIVSLSLAWIPIDSSTFYDVIIVLWLDFFCIFLSFSLSPDEPQVESMRLTMEMKHTCANSTDYTPAPCDGYTSSPVQKQLV